MGTVLASLLPILGPAWFAVRRFLPTSQDIKAAVFVVVALAVLATGVLAGWALRSLGEDGRIATAARAAVTKANLEAQLKAKDKAIADQKKTLDARAADLEATEAENSQLKNKLEALRDKAPDPKRPVLPADHPWMLGKR